MVYIATANIRNNPDMRRDFVRADVAKIRRVCGVAMFQEIGEESDKRDVEHSLGRAWELANRPLDIPIAFKKRIWEVVEIGFQKMHGGKEKTSPSRFVTWVVLKRRSRRVRKARLICFMNTHFVSGAWNLKPKRNKAWRRRMWRVHWRKMRELVLDFYNRGITVVFAGDFNRRFVRKFHKAQVWISKRGIDKIGLLVARGGTRVRVAGARRVRLHSDHDARVAHIFLRAA